MNKAVYYINGIGGAAVETLLYKSLDELDRQYNGVLGIETESTLCNLQRGLVRVYDFKQIQILNNAVYFMGEKGEIYGRLIKLNRPINELEVKKEKYNGSYKIVKKCVAENLVRTPLGKRVLEETIKLQKQQKQKNEKVKNIRKYTIYTTKWDVNEFIRRYLSMAIDVGIDPNKRESYKWIKDNMNLDLMDIEDCKKKAAENNQDWLKQEMDNLPHNKIGMIVGIIKCDGLNVQKLGFQEYKNISISELLPQMLGKDMCGRDGETEVYTENDELRATQKYQGATLYIIYREVTNIELWYKLKDKIYNQQAFSIEELNKCTCSLYPYVAKAYSL